MVAITNPHGQQFYLSLDDFLQVWDSSLSRLVDEARLGCEMIEANEVEYWSALGYADKVMESIAAGRKVNARGENGYTALHAAVVNEHAAIVKLLLKHGADLSARLDSGETPADLAKLTENDEIIGLLNEAVTKQ